MLPFAYMFAPLRNAIFFFGNLFYKKRKEGASILMYHSVGENGSWITVRGEMFEKQLAYLAASGRNVVSLDMLLERLQKNESVDGLVVLTFDDGYADNLHIAYPALKKYRFPATFFIATGFLGKTFPTSSGVSIEMMTTAELKKLAADSEMQIMPHTVNHQIVRGMNADELEKEIQGSKAFLEQTLGGNRNIFAYPKGRYDDAVIAYLKEHRWRAALTTICGLVRPGDDLYLLRRNTIDADTTMTEFIAKLCPTIELYEKVAALYR